MERQGQVLSGLSWAEMVAFVLSNENCLARPLQHHGVKEGCVLSQRCLALPGGVSLASVENARGPCQKCTPRPYLRGSDLAEGGVCRSMVLSTRTNVSLTEAGSGLASGILEAHVVWGREG